MSESDDLADDIRAAVKKSKNSSTGSVSEGVSSQPESAPESDVPSMGDSPSDRPEEGIDMTELNELIDSIKALTTEVQALKKALPQQFSALEQKIAAQASAPSTTNSAPVKPSFPAAVLTSVGKLKPDELNKSENDAKMQLELIVTSLKGSYPDVKRDEMREQLMEATGDHGLLLKPYFGDVLDGVIVDAYGNAKKSAPKANGFKLPKLGKGPKAATEPKSPPSGGSKPNWGKDSR